MSKIEVPKDMAQAGATGWVASRGPDGQMNPMEVARSVLGEALRWLDKELEKLIQKPPDVTQYFRSESMYDQYVRQGNNIAIANVRKLFIAPEIDRIDFYIKGVNGEFVPFQPTEAQKEMLKHFGIDIGGHDEH